MWAAAAERPGQRVLLHEQLALRDVNNTPTADILVWSAMSPIALLVVWGRIHLYGRWSRKIGWQSTDTPTLAFRQPGEVQITPSQRVTGYFFPGRGLAVLGPDPAGGSDRALLGGSVELLRPRPGTTAPVQPGTYVARPAVPVLDRGIVPGSASSWPRSSPAGSPSGSSACQRAARCAVPGCGRHPAGHQAERLRREVGEGFDLRRPAVEYLDLPRLWYIPAACLGLFLWIAIIYRAIRSRLRTESKLNMPWLFFYSGLAIPAFSTLSACSPATETRITGGVLAVLGRTCGWRTSWNCSPR